MLKWKYLREATDSTADGCPVTCNHNSVDQGRCKLGGMAHILIFEGWTVIVQTWKG